MVAGHRDDDRYIFSYFSHQLQPFLLRYPSQSLIMSELQSREEEEVFKEAVEHVSSFVLGKVIKATIELGVFDLLAASGPHAKQTTAEICAQLQLTNNAMVDQMLGLLTSHSFVTCSSTTDRDGRSQNRYVLTPKGRLFTDGYVGISLAQFFLFNHDRKFNDYWHHLKEAVQDGVNPFRRRHGATPYEYMGSNSDISNNFNVAMENHSSLVTKFFINKYNKELMEINELVEVGGGTGATLGSIVSKFPHIKGINFDLPHVISQAPSIPGLEHAAGNMFDVIPSGGAILFKSVLHNWDDEHCVIVLKNCWRALPHSGKVILVEYILPEASEANFSAHHKYEASIAMMCLFEGAKERTENEFRSLAKKAGFSEFRNCCEFLHYNIMELVK